MDEINALSEDFARSEWQQLVVTWDANEQAHDEEEGTQRVSHWEIMPEDHQPRPFQLCYTLADPEMARIAAALSELAQTEVGAPFAEPVDVQVHTHTHTHTRARARTHTHTSCCMPCPHQHMVSA